MLWCVALHMCTDAVRTVCSPYSQPVLHMVCFVLPQGECVVLDAFMSETYVAKLIGYLSLEEKKGSDRFSKSRMTVFVVRNITH